jgi:outer membrane lipoprotein-sorting protein
LLFFALPAIASTPTPLERLDAMRVNLRSLVFEAAIETPKPGGRVGRFEMIFEWSAPDRYRSEIRMGVEGRLVTVADSDRVRTLETRTRRVHVQSRAEAERRIRAFGPVDPVSALATPSIPLASLFRVDSTVIVADRIILILAPRRAVPHYDRLRLELKADDLTPLAAEATKEGRFVSRLRFRSFRRNVPVASGRFQLDLPANATIVSLD